METSKWNNWNKTKLTFRLVATFVKDRKMTYDPNEIAEHFNEYFINLGPNVADKIPASLRNFDSYLGESNLNSIFLNVLNAVTINEIAREIDNLGANKSPGYDEYLQKL